MYNPIDTRRTVQKGFTKKESLKTLGTRVSCKTGTGLGGQKAKRV